MSTRNAGRSVVVLLGTASWLSACSASDGGSVAAGDGSMNLDSLARRGDSLVAFAQTPVDSAGTVASTRAESSRTASVVSAAGNGTLASARPEGEVGGAEGNAISRRARERADSMVRAMTSRYTATTGARARADSVRGVLVLAPNAMARQVVLKSGEQTISLSGMATTGLAKLVGTEVVVRGVQITPRDVVVSDFIVRASNGTPAYDGTLDAGGALRLTDGSGVKRVPLPAELRGVSGARVWIAVRNGTAVAGGVIGR